jgi:hypothetical protein|tara:strand:- start:121 stop:1341 length:1221 start_codon:yes stop_codon:yes gene_type:complete
MNELQEQMKNEIAKYAEKTGISVEEAQATFDSLVTEHNLDTNTEQGLLVARSVFRAKFASTRARMQAEPTNDNTGDEVVSYTKKATGFFYAVEPPRNWEENRRNNLLAEFQRDAQMALNTGNIAVAVQLADGNYEVTKLVDDEIVTKVLSKLPNTEPMQVDDDRWIIPVDNRKSFGSGTPNPNYGRPLPAEAWTRRLFFVGQVGTDSQLKTFQLRLKDDSARAFNPSTFTWYEFDCIPNSNIPNLLHGRKDGSTVTSLKTFQSELDMNTVIDSVLGNIKSSLLELENFHNNVKDKPSHERMVVVEGNAANMRLSSNGNQTVYLSDLNAEFSYGDDDNASTPCWIPQEMEIDFGIGSNLMIVGRTSQSVRDGEVMPVSINVLGINVLHRHGSTEIVSQPVEDLTDWF